MIKRFPHYHQPDAKDCGPTCLKIVSKHFGRDLNLSFIRQVSETNVLINYVLWMQPKN